MTLNRCSVHRSRRMHQSSSRVKASSAPKGSSSSSIFGSWISARQIAGALLHAARELPRELVLVAAEADASAAACARARAYSSRLALEAASGTARRSRAAAARCRASCATAAATTPGTPCPMIFSGPVTARAVDQDRARRRHACRPGRELHEGRLAAARRPDDGDELARADLQVDVLDRELALARAAPRCRRARRPGSRRSGARPRRAVRPSLLRRLGRCRGRPRTAGSRPFQTASG